MEGRCLLYSYHPLFFHHLTRLTVNSFFFKKNKDKQRQTNKQKTKLCSFINLLIYFVPTRLLKCLEVWSGDEYSGIFAIYILWFQLLFNDLYKVHLRYALGKLHDVARHQTISVKSMAEWGARVSIIPVEAATVYIHSCYIWYINNSVSSNATKQVLPRINDVPIT